METKTILLDDNREKLSFLYFTDNHHSATNPENRIDDLTETSLLKLNEVLNIAKDREVDFILNGGDFFEKPDTTDSLAGKVIEVLRDNKIPLFIVPGGHDIYGNNLNSLYRTKLGLLEKSQFCNLLIHPNSNEFIIKNNNLSLQLTGTASHFGIDQENIEDDYILKRKNADFAIHCVHGMLLPKPFFPNTPTVFIDEILDTKADITLGAHNHLGFDTICKNGKYFANPGSMVRKTNNLKEMNRLPKVYIISLSSKKGIEFETIYLKTAKPGIEVLSRENIEKNQRINVSKEQFITKIKRSQKMKILKVNEIIDRISQNKKLPKRVIKKTLEKLSLAREELGEDDINIEQGSKDITKIELFNFGGYIKETIYLSKGINMFVGPSSNGKTTIFRALKWVFFNEPRGDDFVRWENKDKKADITKVIITLADGNKITRERKKKKNIYILERPDGTIEKSENFGINVPEFIKEATSLYKVKIDDETQLMLNIIEQLDAPFLFNETSSKKEKIIGSIGNVNLIDYAQKKINKDIFSNNTKIKYINNELKKIDNELQEYENINNETIMLENIEFILKDIKLLDIKLKSIMNLRNKLNIIKKEKLETQKQLSNLENMQLIQEKYILTKENLLKINNLSILQNKFNITKTNIEKNNIILSKIKNIDTIEINKIELLFQKINTFYVLQSKINENKKNIRICNNVLYKLKNLELLENNISICLNRIQNNKQITKLNNNFTNCKLKIKQELTNKEKLKNIDNINGLIENLNKKVKNIEQMKNLITKYNVLNNNILVENKSINKNVEFMLNKFENISNLILKLKSIYTLNSNLQDKKERLKQGNIYTQKINNKLNNLAIIYTNLLRKEGSCPFCNHKIEEKELQLILKNIKEDF